MEKTLELNKTFRPPMEVAEVYTATTPPVSESGARRRRQNALASGKRYQSKEALGRLFDVTAREVFDLGLRMILTPTIARERKRAEAAQKRRKRAVKGQIERARLELFRAGLTDTAIARKVEVHKSTVGRWRKRFVAEGKLPDPLFPETP